MEKLLYNADLLTAKEQEIVGINNGLAVVNNWPDSLKVGVHDGPFHADEVMALILLKAFTSSEISWVRTRDPQELSEVDLRIDVGEGLLDHHGSRAEKGVAAVSRVWQLLKQDPEALVDLPAFIVEKIDKLVDDVAGVDTGVEGSVNHFEDVSILSQLAEVRRDFDGQFEIAMKVAEQSFLRRCTLWWEQARSLETAQAEIDAQKDEDVIVFSREARMAPVKEMMWKQRCKATFYVSPEGESDWRVLCCADTTKEFSPFSSKRLIPERFRGLRAEALDNELGFPRRGSIFCHAAGFIAGFLRQKTAVEFAKLCLK